MSPSMERFALFLTLFFAHLVHAEAIAPADAIHDQLGCSGSTCISQASPHSDDGERGPIEGLLSSANQVPVILATCSERIFTCGVIPFGRGAARVALTLDNHTRGRGSPDAVLGCPNTDCPDWPTVAEAEAASTDIPEPGTMVLSLTGLMALLWCAKLHLSCRTDPFGRE